MPTVSVDIHSLHRVAGESSRLHDTGSFLAWSYTRWRGQILSVDLWYRNFLTPTPGSRLRPPQICNYWNWTQKTSEWTCHKSKDGGGDGGIDAGNEGKVWTLEVVRVSKLVTAKVVCFCGWLQWTSKAANLTPFSSVCWNILNHMFGYDSIMVVAEAGLHGTAHSSAGQLSRVCFPTETQAVLMLQKTKWGGNHSHPEWFIWRQEVRVRGEVQKQQQQRIWPCQQKCKKSNFKWGKSRR